MKSTFLFYVVAIPLAIFALIVYLASERISGSEAWDEALAAYTADGESIDPSIRFAKPVPDEQNFAAIPELRGLNARDDRGEAQRAKLNRLGLRLADHPWPKKSPKRQPHEPREKQPLKPYHDYFLETELIPVEPSAQDLASDLIRALEISHGQTIAAIVNARDRRHAILLPLLLEVAPDAIDSFSGEAFQTKPIMSIARGLSFHALLALRTGRTDSAQASLATCYRLSEAASADGKSLITHLVALEVAKLTIQTIWEGNADRSWSAEQLSTLQTQIGTLDFRQQLTDAYRAELAGSIDLLNQVEKDPKVLGATIFNNDGARDSRLTYALFFHSWIDHNKASYLGYFHEKIILPVKSKGGYLAIKRDDSDTQSELGSSINPRKIFARIMVPATTMITKRTAQLHATLTQAATTCALERYYLINQSYPDQLQDLVPNFAAELPLDPMDHKPMRYQKTGDDHYQLHSIGWDGNDDNGNAGDITWNYKGKGASAQRQ